MKLVLTGRRQIEVRPSEAGTPTAGMTPLRVRYCGVCRTDAKMWNEGHRDLVLPRVPGHELLAVDETGARFTVWPGRACGHCRYCASGRENLCETMRIMGFHFDGGFSHHLLAPTGSLVPVPAAIPPHLACFAEPAGCVLNALEKLALEPGRRIIIYGGGTVGLLAALIAGQAGAEPLVIEKNAAKISRTEAFLDACHIPCMHDTPAADFDAAINACPDPIAFNLAITKLAKGGRIAFFSGLGKDRTVATDLINLLHYREISLVGAYGLCRRHIRAALEIIERHQAAIEHLVEALVPPEALGERLPDLLAGRNLKMILDFTASAAGRRPSASRRRPGTACTTGRR